MPGEVSRKGGYNSSNISNSISSTNNGDLHDNTIGRFLMLAMYVNMADIHLYLLEIDQAYQCVQALNQAMSELVQDQHPEYWALRAICLVVEKHLHVHIAPAA
jgi:hypothetical protein